MKIPCHRKLISGNLIFQLMDSKGLPLEIVNDLLREKGLGFDVVDFIEAALASGNFTYSSIKTRLVQAMVYDEMTRANFTRSLDAVAKKKSW